MDIQNSFMYIQLKKMIDKNVLNKGDKTLVVCGGDYDDKVLSSLEFEDYTISSIGNNENIRNFVEQDVQNLTFKDRSFDNVIVHAGLHHCRSPHRALCEMYRVSKKNIIVFEAKDTFLMRIFVNLGLTVDYELDAVIANKTFGGVDNTIIPNYIYRWNSREVEKTIKSYDPTITPVINFYSKFYFHETHMEGFLGNHIISKIFGKKLSKFIFKIAVFVLNVILKNQGNSFMFVIRKSKSALKIWVHEIDGEVTFKV